MSLFLAVSRILIFDFIGRCFKCYACIITFHLRCNAVQMYGSMS
jgi:hypothetical protein